jgi:hypothetical protein
VSAGKVDKKLPTVIATSKLFLIPIGIKVNSYLYCYTTLPGTKGFGVKEIGFINRNFRWNGFMARPIKFGADI